MKAEREAELRLELATERVLEAVGNAVKEPIAEMRENVRRRARREALEEAAALLDGKPELYPTTVFLEPPAGEHGKTVDGCSAAALRRMAPRWASEIRALMEKEE